MFGNFCFGPKGTLAILCAVQLLVYIDRGLAHKCKKNPCRTRELECDQAVLGEASCRQAAILYYRLHWILLQE